MPTFLKLEKYQAGCQEGRDVHNHTTEMVRTIMAQRLRLSKVTQQDGSVKNKFKYHCLLLIDFAKAYDSVNRKKLMQILRERAEEQFSRNEYSASLSRE